MVAVDNAGGHEEEASRTTVRGEACYGTVRRDTARHRQGGTAKRRFGLLPQPNGSRSLLTMNYPGGCVCGGSSSGGGVVVGSVK